MDEVAQSNGFQSSRQVPGRATDLHSLSWNLSASRYTSRATISTLKAEEMSDKPREQGEDKRKVRRLPCCLEVTQESKSASLGELHDLSLDGAFLTSQAAMPHGTVMPILFKIDASTELRAEAEVVRVTDAGMGLRFIRMGAKDSRRLRRYIVELSDAVGARDSAQMLLNTDSHITRPIREPRRIQTLLRQGGGRYYIFPASRALRVEGRAEYVGSDALRVQCKAAPKLVVNEPVICLYAHDFASFSFRSAVLSMASTQVTLAVPSEVCYSERRSSQRTPVSSHATVTLNIPGNPPTASPFPIVDASSSGFSFKAPVGQTLFSVGTAFAEMVMLKDGVESTVYDVSIRHLTTMLEDAGETWMRVGASCNVKRAQHGEHAEKLDLDESATLLSRVKSAGAGAAHQAGVCVPLQKEIAACSRDAWPCLGEVYQCPKARGCGSLR